MSNATILASPIIRAEGLFRKLIDKPFSGERSGLRPVVLPDPGLISTTADPFAPVPVLEIAADRLPETFVLQINHFKCKSLKYFTRNTGGLVGGDSDSDGWRA